MRKLIIIICVFFHTATVWAQNNAMEAKAAYLLAEEEFSAGKYDAAINYLDLAVVKLGSTNAKISYLKVVILQMQAKKDDNFLPRLREAIDAFETASDYPTFNEEKKLEIIKLKLKLARPDVSLVQEEDMTAIYQKYQPDGWFLGLTIEEAKTRKPDYFAKAKMSMSKDGSVISYDLTYGELDYKTTRLEFEKGKLTYILIVLYNSDETKIFSKLNSLKSTCMSWFSGTPVESKTENSDKTSKYISTFYTWKDGKVVATLSFNEHSMNFGMGSKAYHSNIGIVVTSK